MVAPAVSERGTQFSLKQFVLSPCAKFYAQPSRWGRGEERIPNSIMNKFALIAEPQSASQCQI